MSKFSSKKWFNEMSPEQKQEICNKFDITEDILKKAGYMGENNHVYIDMLRVHYDNPPEWKDYLNNINTYIDTYKTKLENPIDFIIDIYKKFNPDVKFKKYKETSYNKMRLNTTVKYISNIFDSIIYNNKTDIQEYNAYTIYNHCELFLSDTNMI